MSLFLKARLLMIWVKYTSTSKIFLCQLLQIHSGSNASQCSGKGHSRTCKSNTSKHEVQDGVLLVTNRAGRVLYHPKAGPVCTNTRMAKAQTGHRTLHPPTEAAVVDVINRVFKTQSKMATASLCNLSAPVFLPFGEE
jgi:hypothetical protein